jgi:lipoprotein-anchoring transpeptidase ErfK/SrfK
MVKDGSKVGTKPGTIHNDGVVWDTYWGIGIGRLHSPTPMGVFEISEKIDNPAEEGWDNHEMYGTRVMHLNIKADGRPYSIHGTDDPDSVGWMCSGGCIRLRNEEMEQLYDMIEVGDTVVITMSTARPGEEDWLGSRRK